MKCRILHETRGRIRMHVCRASMTGEQADILEVFLKSLKGVREASVDERTQNAVIRFCPDARDELLQKLARFHYEDTSIAAPEHSSRALNRRYEGKMVRHVLKRVMTRMILPLPARTVLTAVKSVPYLYRGIRSLLRGKIEVSILDAASITVSMVRGEFDTAGSVMFLLGIGDIMEEWTHRKSVEDLADAMALNVDKVWVRTEDGSEVLTGIDKISEGDLILVRTGNLIPLDGLVEEGEAMVNQASITGESLPVHKKPGGFTYAGTVVDEGELLLKVRHVSGSGQYDRIVKMIEESEKLKSAAEDKASHLADRLVPWTFGATVLTYLLSRNAARAASILMVDFCCALKLSMPIAVLSAMREASRHHISVKGGKFMESFAEAQTIVFDKTGTLTNASPRLRRIVTFGDYAEDETLKLAACLEEHYPHSIANAVVREAMERGISHEEEHTKVEYIVAHGIASSIGGRKVRIGSYHFIFEDEKCRIPEGKEPLFDSLPDEFSHLYMAIDGMLCAVLLIEDPLKEEAAEVVRSLHALGIGKVVMMTGDSERTARSVAAKVGVDAYHSEVLPQDKAAFIRSEHEAGRKVIMVGDGVNDSPALSESDAGVAINSGAAIAREIADITISQDDLHALLVMRSLSEKLMQRISWNYHAILSFNSFLILMGVLGVFPSATTALFHNMSTILISLRSMTDLLPETEKF